MTSIVADISHRQAARTAGFAYLIIIVAGIFAEFFVRSSLIIPGDAATTAANIMASQSLYRLGFAGDLIMLICDVIVALALYVLLKPVNKSLALLATAFRLIQTSILGINLLNHYYALMILNGGGYLGVFETNQLQALTMLFLNAHGHGYLIGQVFFGLHCLAIGYLTYKSSYFPRFIGILLVLASLGYLIESFTNLLFPGHEAITYPGLAFAVIAEFSLCFWLLFKSGKFDSEVIQPVTA
jgi:hypothetical protein